MPPQDTGRPLSFSLLCGLALHSSIIELVVHMTVGSFYILARLNPNQTSGRPTPVSQVVSLLVVKMACELITVCVLATWAARARMDSQWATPNVVEDLWRVVGWGTWVHLGALSFVWALETQTTFVFYLCPFLERPDLVQNATSIRLGSLGLCPRSSFV